jgi:dolichyl-phosphate beta-glucosyltransferase
LTPPVGHPGLDTVVVVPCFNEEHRLDEDAFAALSGAGAVSLLFVDDGSRDGTAEVLARLAKGCDRTQVLTLAHNAGKAEAVRRGVLAAVEDGAEAVAYYDADLATPPDQLVRLVEILAARPDLVGVLGSRVARLGGVIDRRALRHYLGRAYATLASLSLGVTVYDTQCGAKVFRVTDALAAAVARPFRSSWAFDVELLHRLLVGGPGAQPVAAEALLEVPLERWRDVGGSKLRLVPALRALFDLVVVARERADRGSR